MNTDVLAVDVKTFWVFDFLKDGEKELELLERAKDYAKRHNENAEYKIMTWDEFKAGEREFLLRDDKLEEITKDKWNEMLNVLPPILWCTIDGVEMFCMSEMTTGTYTTQCARYKGKYYWKTVDCADKSTWIHNMLVKE